jgi:hypothetical protein
MKTRAMLGMTALLLTLGGCGHDKTQQAASLAAKTAATTRQAPQTATEQTASMVDAPTVGRATAPLHLKFEIAQRPVAGQTIVISLALIPGAAAQSLTLQLADPAGLVIADKADRQIGAVQPETVYRQEINASAPAAGVFFLNLTATMTQDAGVETRHFSIPIIVAAT